MKPTTLLALPFGYRLAAAGALLNAIVGIAYLIHHLMGVGR